MGKTATLERSSRNGHTPTADAEIANRIHSLPIELVTVESNVRVVMAGIDELAASIAEKGVLQPIKVRHAPVGDGYVVTWGHRRLLASRQAGLTQIPSIIDDTEQSEHERAIEQLVENLNREDLAPLDRARAMRTVVDAGVSQADLARQVGLAPSTVANDLRILEAAPAVHEALENGQITASHAKALLPLPVTEQDSFVKRVVSGGLSAHRLEEEVGWKLQELRGKELTVERTTKQAPRLIAALEAAKVPKQNAIALRTPYNLNHAPLEIAIKKAGWNLVERGTYARERGPASKCDCSVVLVEFNRSWKVEPGCIDSQHRDRQVNDDHVAAEKRANAIAAKIKRLQELVAASLVGLPPELVKLLAVQYAGDLPELWAFQGDLAETRTVAAERIARGADPTRIYSRDDQAKHDRLLDTVVEAFERLAGPTSDDLEALGVSREVQEAVARGEARDPAYGDAVVAIAGASYRVHAVGTKLLFLVLDGPSWDLGPEGWRADPALLEWDPDASVWRGPVTAEATPA